MAIVGHENARRVLEENLPPVVMFVGPTSTGRRTLGEHLLRHHGAEAVDIYRAVEGRFGADQAREVISHFGSHPFGPFKAALLDLDEATPQALNALLKVLEEPPPDCHFILLSSRPTLLTVASRAQVWRTGLLTDAEVAEVLQIRLGVPSEKAAHMAHMAGGRVEGATGAEALEVAKAPVLSLLKATADGNEDLLANALGKVDGTTIDLIGVWVVEATTKRWRIFNADEGFGLADDVALLTRIQKALKIGARPRLTVRLAFADALEARR